MSVDIRAVVESELARFGVPAAAVSVVADGQVVFAEAIGTRDLEAAIPVTARTRFPLASDTKAFTAALLCLQAAEGLLDLDAPVSTALPWFRLQDLHASTLVSVRDLLAHRSGVPRHDWVGAGEAPGLTLEDLARAMAHLEPALPLRQAPLYSNLGYCAAGLVSEVLAGSPWAGIVTERLLQPLGMNDACLHAGTAQVGDFAHGYSRFTGELVRQAPIPAEHLGPPGGLFCTASDLGPWLLARLGLRPEVLPPEVLGELHGPSIVYPAGPDPERLPLGYALGCLVEAYHGDPFVHHGGSLPGWSSDVAVLPGRGLGIAVVCNLDQTPFPEVVVLTLADALLGRPAASWGERRLTRHTAEFEAWRAARTAQSPAQHRPPRVPFVELAGTYRHPAYGDLVLRTQGDGLALDFHGMPGLDLVHVDRDRWEVRALDGLVAVPLVPEPGADGGVAAVSVAFEPLVRPIRFTTVRES